MFPSGQLQGGIGGQVGQDYNKAIANKTFDGTVPEYLQPAAQAPVYDAAAAAQARQVAAQKAQLQAQLGQLDSQQSIGLGNIDSSYNLGANRLGQQNAVAERDYSTRVGQNGQSYSNTRNGIQQNARATNNSLQRLLGMNGAGNSSAAYEQAPYATALQASTGLNDAQQTYAKNGQALDTNWQDTQRSYQNSLQDLDNQKFQQQNSLKSSIAQTRANLLSQIQQVAGTTENQNQINSLLGQITSLGQQYANPVLRTADVKYAAPDLGQYTLGQQTAPSTQGGAASDVNPSFLNILTGDQKRDQYGNLIG